MSGWSIGEVRSLAVKAARGAGFSWGMSEEAGFAVTWLQQRSAPGARALANYLTDGRAKANTCPLLLGTAIADGAIDLPDGGLEVAAPLLIVPFIAPVMQSQPRSMSFASTHVTFDLETCELADEAVASAAHLSQIVFNIPSTKPSGKAASRVSEHEVDAIKVLESFAAKTYAPATEQSRLAGAGAGTSDND